jgi:hypothetical protein
MPARRQSCVRAPAPRSLSGGNAIRLEGSVRDRTEYSLVWCYTDRDGRPHEQIVPLTSRGARAAFGMAAYIVDVSLPRDRSLAHGAYVRPRLASDPTK